MAEDFLENWGAMLDNVRMSRPLIHNITNYVAANDVANVLLACGASPIMANEPEEVEEITSRCDGLAINLGTLNQQTMEAMLRAGRASSALGHATLLDPVGIGASALRKSIAHRLLDQVKFTVIRGNVSEIITLAGGDGGARGVDARSADNRGDHFRGAYPSARDLRSVSGENSACAPVQSSRRPSHGFLLASAAGHLRQQIISIARPAHKKTEESIQELTPLLCRFSRETGAILVVTGATDLICDGATCLRVDNGRPEMSRITGVGCQLSGLICAFVAANPDQPLAATAAAVSAMGVAGELGWLRMQEGDGNATYRNRIIDAVYHLDGEQLDRLARITPIHSSELL